MTAAGSTPSGEGWRPLASTIGSLLTSNVVNRATSFVVYAMVAGFLGARQLGQLALAMSLFFLVNRFALLGLETLITREIADDRSKAARYLGSASLAVAVSSLLAWPLIWGFGVLIGYPADTVKVILLLFLGLVPFTLSQLTEATFVALGRGRYVAFANPPIWIAQTGVVFVLLRGGQGVDMVALSIAVAYAAIAALHWLLILREVPARSLRLDATFIPSLLRRAAPFLGIQGVNAVKANATIVLLSVFASESAVGVFAAANQLLTPPLIIFQAIGQASLPDLVRAFRSGSDSVRRLSRSLVQLTIVIAIPAAVGLVVLAGPVLLLIYRESEFLDSVIVLRIMAWNVVQMALTAVLGQILWAGQRERVALRIAVTNTAAMLLLAGILIVEFGVVGAAVAGLLVGMLEVIQHYVPVHRLLGRFILIPWRPTAASAAMAAVLLLTTGAGLWIRLIAGMGAYAGVMAVLYHRALGQYTRLQRGLQSARIDG